MKKIVSLGVFVLCMVILCSCSNQPAASKVPKPNSIDKVMEDQMNAANMESKEATDELMQVMEQDMNGDQDMSNDQDMNSDQDVDIDLTQMGSDMVYATIFQMMMEPESYEGKKIRIDGNYNVTWYDATSKYYHYVFVKDAAACCAQGIEFIWGDGSHTDQGEYPDENTAIEVIGTFVTYTEDGDSNLYCTLKDATWKVIE